MAARKPPSERERRTVLALYAETRTEAIAERLGCSRDRVYRLAAAMGLRKSAAYLASADACRLRRGDHIGAAHRFKPGNAPHNKGLRSPGYAPGRMAETQFRKGRKPRNWRPIGATRLSKDGYLERKTTDTGYPPRDWQPAHRLLWIEAHGPIPEGHKVAFKDGDKAHLEIGNLELVAAREMMRRNTLHRLPEELKDAIRLNGVVKRKVRERGKKLDTGSAEPSLRDDRSAERQRRAAGREPGAGDQRGLADDHQRRQAGA